MGYLWSCEQAQNHQEKLSEERNHWPLYRPLLAGCIYTLYFFQKATQILFYFFFMPGQVNGSTVDGVTPLSEACTRGHATLVSLLLQHGANPSGSGHSNSPIHRAAAKGQRSHSIHTHSVCAEPAHNRI